MKRAFRRSFLTSLFLVAMLTFSVFGKARALTIINFDDIALPNLSHIGAWYMSTYGVYINGDVLKTWNTSYIPADPGNFKSFGYHINEYWIDFHDFTISRFEWDMVTYPPYDPTTVRVYDSNHNVIYTTSVSSSSGYGQYMTHHVLDLDSLGIADQASRVGLVETYNHYIIDNVGFERYSPPPPPAPVPEPATLFLVGVGIAGLGAVSRKHKNNKT